MDANAMFFDDPKHTRKLFARQQRQDALESGLYHGMRLTAQTKHNDTWILGGRISDDIREIDIQCDERALLSAANVDDVKVWLTAKGLFGDGMHVVPGCAEKRRQRWRKILVEFEFHAALVATTRSRANSAA